MAAICAKRPSPSRTTTRYRRIGPLCAGGRGVKGFERRQRFTLSARPRAHSARPAGSEAGGREFTLRISVVGEAQIAAPGRGQATNTSPTRLSIPRGRRVGKAHKIREEHQHVAAARVSASGDRQTRRRAIVDLSRSVLSAPSPLCRASLQESRRRSTSRLCLMTLRSCSRYRLSRARDSEAVRRCALTTRVAAPRPANGYPSCWAPDGP
jgi:hypothetical protein